MIEKKADNEEVRLNRRKEFEMQVFTPSEVVVLVEEDGILKIAGPICVEIRFQVG